MGSFPKKNQTNKQTIFTICQHKKWFFSFYCLEKPTCLKLCITIFLKKKVRKSYFTIIIALLRLFVICDICDLWPCFRKKKFFFNDDDDFFLIVLFPSTVGGGGGGCNVYNFVVAVVVVVVIHISYLINFFFFLSIKKLWMKYFLVFFM